ncbi:hypothetical protein THASP1DRAFT_24524 [Thamnocephalis sphaerospora]|uniref:Uncharacterized protein n=1 Tax=Thamnocephalis sphaerospora TaxID=78915 RepID=A0A4P9XN19_9FUNG|nr:hypothetical protein THASP1DRAFT_24524 [Thamnocephalis sphaerospora]|eukprot:RKP07305.1 hypothetical protein THASP1DRAFT_24524 [Thamnocephalis sphaerospora]
MAVMQSCLRACRCAVLGARCWSNKQPTVMRPKCIFRESDELPTTTVENAIGRHKDGLQQKKYKGLFARIHELVDAIDRGWSPGQQKGKQSSLQTDLARMQTQIRAREEYPAPECGVTVKGRVCGVIDNVERCQRDECRQNGAERNVHTRMQSIHLFNGEAQKDHQQQCAVLAIAHAATGAVVVGGLAMQAGVQQPHDLAPTGRRPRAVGCYGLWDNGATRLCIAKRMCTATGRWRKERQKSDILVAVGAECDSASHWCATMLQTSVQELFCDTPRSQPNWSKARDGPIIHAIFTYHRPMAENGLVYVCV